MNINVYGRVYKICRPKGQPIVLRDGTVMAKEEGSPYVTFLPIKALPF